MSNSDFADFLKKLTVGGISTVISKTCAAPLDFIKLRYQIMPEMIKSGTLEKPYTGIINSFRRVFNEEGKRAFWKGNLTRIIKYFPN